VEDYDENEFLTAYAHTVGGGYSDTETIIDRHPWLFIKIIKELGPATGHRNISDVEEAAAWVNDTYMGGISDFLQSNPEVFQRLIRQHEDEFVNYELSK